MRLSRPHMLVFIGTFTASCTNVTPVDRAAVYGEIATNVIAPSYSALRATTATLATDAVVFCANPSDPSAFDAVRSALADAHVAYARTNAFEFTTSPVTAQLIPALLDGFPVDTAVIDAILADSSTIDLTMQGTNAQGFYTIEYLVFSAADSAADQARFTDSSTGARRCDYLVAATARAATLADRAADVWDPPSATTFGHELATAGNGSSVFPATGVATTDVCMTLHNLARDLGDERIGRPLGILAMGPTTVDVTIVPGRFAHWTKDDLQASLDSIENLYLGRYGDVDGRGLEDIIRQRSSARDQEMKSAIEDARAAIDAIPGSVDSALSQSPPSPELTTAFDALKSLQSLIALGIGPTVSVFSSAFESDGD